MRINSLYTKIMLSFFTALAAGLACIVIIFILIVENRFNKHVQNELIAAFRITSKGVELLASEGNIDDPVAHAELRHYINDLDVIFKGQVWLEKPDGTVFLSSRPRTVPKFTISNEKYQDRLFYADVKGLSEADFYFAYPVTVFGHNATLAMLRRDDIYYRDAAPFFLMVVQAVGIFTLLLAFPVIRRITVPLRKLEEGALRCASGDLSYRVDMKRGDEVGRVARAFNVMADSVENMLRMKQELMANVSHEMRSPLARIRVALAIAEMRIEEGRTEDALRHLAAVSQEVEDLDSAIGGVIELSRFDAGGAYRVFSSCDLAEMVRSMLQRYAPTIDMKQLQVEVDLPEHLVQDCQKEGFNAIIKNLLENAVKFAEQGGFIRIELAAENAGAVLAVSNSYRQLSEKEISLLFQPFSRGVGEDVPGTGLGLALVERIAVDHGGGVVVENIEDGVRFAVRLPRPRKDESAS